MAEENENVENVDDTQEAAEDVESTVTEDAIDWKAMARKHEKRAKANNDKVTALEAELKELKDRDKSEQDKTLEAAVQKARDEALAEADAERRADRLEVAVTRLAARGVTVGDKTVKFADPEDALIFVKAGETDDIFDEQGQVQTDALTEALVDILKRKPNLAADGPASAGGSDAGRGSGGSGSLSADPEDHFQRIRNKK